MWRVCSAVQIIVVIAGVIPAILNEVNFELLRVYQ